MRSDQEDALSNEEEEDDNDQDSDTSDSDGDHADVGQDLENVPERRYPIRRERRQRVIPGAIPWSAVRL